MNQLNFKKPSIVIPLYNKEFIIKSTLLSILEKSDDYDEIIIVNDCSTDNSLEICRSLTKNFSKVKIINLKNNSGPFKARLIGIKSSRSNWVQLIDADDILLKSFSINDIKKYKSSENSISFIYGKILKKSEQEIFNLFEFFIHGWPNQSSIVVNKQAVLNIQENQRMNWGEDHVFIANLLNYGKCLGLNCKYGEYNISNAERSKNNGTLKNRLKVCFELLRVAKSRSLIDAIISTAIFTTRTFLAWFCKKINLA